LRPTQRFKYGFVGISGHLTSFLKCSHDTCCATPGLPHSDADETRRACRAPRGPCTRPRIFIPAPVDRHGNVSPRVAAMLPLRRDPALAIASEPRFRNHTLPQSN
jgi:hypothetical protein